ncbi:aminotransferase class V-fold PLP-dependent enzyme [Amycolatopsis sp. QT-25]|uniref:kynureninase n=1 Tax=Amycolatopsis sp. QT-25 TaxID=3034022 RepID=UPI0023EB3510|nr:aminotransferase class V-fold PLP-dependent enzyme [Amycolatopsis sp. QT-25]WET78165.1 aminotransferase class V-fold PLP-dependent enzyme [Amycolatopsis sp. QT-25]
MTTVTDLVAEAAALDAADPLAHKRNEFDLDAEVAYFDGNSLGAPPKHVADRVAAVVREQWGGRLIRSWSEGWWEAPMRVGERIAPLVGAAPGQLVVADSTSVNLFKALVAATRLGPGRDEILVDADTFPTDGYIADEVARLTGRVVRRVVAEDMPREVSERTAVALINHVDYVTGRAHDMATLTVALHRAGALVLWDLCHSVGALPVELDAAGVDLAVGCTYKFLNGGPGAPAFLYVATKWLESFEQPLAGWAGDRDPFVMRGAYEASDGIPRGRAGTPDILSLLALDAALDVWDGVDRGLLRAKGLALGEFFFQCADELLDGATIATPRGQDRGHQISVVDEDAAKTMAALIERGVIGDFRPPDVLRFGLAPLYTTYGEVLRAVTTLRALRHENKEFPSGIGGK